MREASVREENCHMTLQGQLWKGLIIITLLHFSKKKKKKKKQIYQNYVKTLYLIPLKLITCAFKFYVMEAVHAGIIILEVLIGVIA